MIPPPQDPDAKSDRTEDRQILKYQWKDPAYGINAKPGIEIIVRVNPDTAPRFVIYELNNAWLEICRTINDGGKTT